jgi:hypothetical protein
MAVLDVRSIGPAAIEATADTPVVRRQQRLGPAETVGATDAATRRAGRHAAPRPAAAVPYPHAAAS